MPNAYTLFADESGTSKPAPCFSIGVLTVPEEAFEAFSEEFVRLRAQHGVVGELRWTKIATSHGAMNCTIDLLKYVLKAYDGSSKDKEQVTTSGCELMG